MAYWLPKYMNYQLREQHCRVQKDFEFCNHKKPAEAFNKGIQNASGDIIAILNSDDYFATENTLQIVAKIFLNHEIDFAYGDILFIDPIHGTNQKRSQVFQAIFHGINDLKTAIYLSNQEKTDV